MRSAAVAAHQAERSAMEDKQENSEPGVQLGRAHWQRLRQMYRSAGWPCLDNIEVDLLASGLLQRVVPENGREYLRVTDAGIQALSEWLKGNRRSRSAHQALVDKTAEWLATQGRVAYTELSLRARPQDKWLKVRPDIYSIRRTSREAYLEPAAYEIKVRRADLLSDLKRPDKRNGYLFTASCCFYVINEGVAAAEEIPPECGVIIATDTGLSVARPAPVSEFEMPFSTWMALARATPWVSLGAPEARF